MLAKYPLGYIVRTMEAPYYVALSVTMSDAARIMSRLPAEHPLPEADEYQLHLAARFLDDETSLGTKAPYSDPAVRIDNLVPDVTEALGLPPNASRENALALLGRVSLTFEAIHRRRSPNPSDIEFAGVFASSMHAHALARRHSTLWRS